MGFHSVWHQVCEPVRIKTMQFEPLLFSAYPGDHWTSKSDSTAQIPSFSSKSFFLEKLLSNTKNFIFPDGNSLHKKVLQTRALSCMPANHCAHRGFPVNDNSRELSWVISTLEQHDTYNRGYSKLHCLSYCTHCC